MQALEATGRDTLARGRRRRRQRCAARRAGSRPARSRRAAGAGTDRAVLGQRRHDRLGRPLRRPPCLPEYLRATPTRRRMSVEVVLYRPPGCHLCDVAKQVLEAQRPLLGFELEVIDISGDAAGSSLQRADPGGAGGRPQGVQVPGGAGGARPPRHGCVRAEPSTPHRQAESRIGADRYTDRAMSQGTAPREGSLPRNA